MLYSHQLMQNTSNFPNYAINVQKAHWARCHHCIDKRSQDKPGEEQQQGEGRWLGARHGRQLYDPMSALWHLPSRIGRCLPLALYQLKQFQLVQLSGTTILGPAVMTACQGPFPEVHQRRTLQVRHQQLAVARKTAIPPTLANTLTHCSVGSDTVG